MKKQITDRIFKSWKTTLIGIVLIASAILAVFEDKATLTEALFFITGGVGFFFFNEKPTK